MKKNLTFLQKKTLECTSDLKNICQVIDEQYHIDAFSYARLDSNGHLIYLATDADWLEFYYGQEFHAAKTISKNPILLQNEFTSWDAIQDCSVVATTREFFGLSQGITHIVRNKDHLSIYNFSTTTDRINLYNWFINHIDVIKLFVHYYNDKSQAILNKLDKVRQQTQNAINPATAKIVEDLLSSKDENKKLCLKTLLPNEFKIDFKNKTSVLNFREHQCLCFLLHGFSAKETAKELSLSPRTIEFYLNTIKKKLGFISASDLNKIFIKNNVPDLFLIYGRLN